MLAKPAGPTPKHAKPLRVLLTEGGSTSAREAVTALGLAGHHIEICDPDPRCLARASRFVRRFHHCPGLRRDPLGFFNFIEQLLWTRRFDVLLPIHEQGLLFARFAHRLPPDVGVALPRYDSYRLAHSKDGFSRLLDELGLSQPATHRVTSASELRAVIRLPSVVKTAIGTASRGVWIVHDGASLASACRDLAASAAFADGVVAQDFAAGVTEHAQAVFCRGALVGFHATRQLAVGAGGGDMRKLSIERPDVRADVAHIGQRLDWHGALSVDWIQPAQGAKPLYIDCNPRLVEPMSAALAECDLMDLLLDVSQGATPPAVPDGRAGVRTHLAMQALLGCARRGGTRRDVLRECAALWAGRGPYAGSVEELTPVRSDWVSALPLAATALLLLADPAREHDLEGRGWGAHLLDANTIRRIEQAAL